MSETNPTVLVSWAHVDPGWTPAEVDARRDHISRLTQALRDHGIDADVDLFHAGRVDWTQWGPRRVTEVDHILVVASRAWAAAWDGTGDPHRNIGAAAEAAAIRSMENERGRGTLKTLCRVIMLPGSDDAPIPTGMHGVERYSLSTYTSADLEDLLRDLTDQPLVTPRPLGALPVFPSDASVGASDDRAGSGGAPSPSQGGGDRAAVLRATLAALPTPREGEGPSLPWFRARANALAELARLESTGQDAPATTGAAVWEPVAAPVDVPWADTWRQSSAVRDTALFVHLVPQGSARMSTRQRVLVSDALAGLVREVGLVAAIDDIGRDENEFHTTIQLRNPASTPFGAVVPGGFGGVRVDAGGTVSVWFRLARDSMGAVLDPSDVASAFTHCLQFAGTVVSQVAPGVARVAVAAEVTPAVMLTSGTAADLGRRSSTTMPGALGRQRPLIDAEETLPVAALSSPSHEIVDALATLLLRNWP